MFGDSGKLGTGWRKEEVRHSFIMTIRLIIFLLSSWLLAYFILWVLAAYKLCDGWEILLQTASYKIAEAGYELEELYSFRRDGKWWITLLPTLTPMYTTSDGWWFASPAYILKINGLPEVAAYGWRQFILAAGLASGGASLLAFIMYLWFRSRVEDDKWHQINGTPILSEKKMGKTISKAMGRGSVAITPQISWPVDRQSEHMLIIGSTGSGKTNTILKLLSDIRIEGNQWVILDAKKEFTEEIRDDEIIFSPSEIEHPNHLKWNIFNEMQTDEDIEAMANAIIKEVSNEEGFWVDSARTLFAGLISHIMDTQESPKTHHITDLLKSHPDTKKLVETLKRGGVTELTLDAIQVLGDKAHGQAAGVRGHMTNAIKGLKALAKCDGDFSFKTWVREGRGGLILRTSPKLKTVFGGILSMAVDIIADEIISLPTSQNHKIYLALDEIAEIPQPDKIMSLLKLGRSKGAVLILTGQDLNVIKAAFGEDAMKSITGNTLFQIFMKSPDPTTQSIITDIIGQGEFEKEEVSSTLSTGETMDTRNKHTVTQERPVIRPDALKTLGRGEAFLHIPEIGVAKIKIPKVKE